MTRVFTDVHQKMGLLMLSQYEAQFTSLVKTGLLYNGSDLAKIN